MSGGNLKLENIFTRIPNKTKVYLQEYKHKYDDMKLVQCIFTNMQMKLIMKSIMNGIYSIVVQSPYHEYVDETDNKTNNEWDIQYSRTEPLK